jgi:hypothetical protein
MKKSGRKSGIHIHLSNRLSYTLIAIGILIIIAVGVYAIGEVPNPGHPISQLQTCDNNQILETVNGAWSCVALPSTSVCPSGFHVAYNINYNAEQETKDCSSFGCSSYYQQYGGYQPTGNNLYSDTCNGDRENPYTCPTGVTKTCQDSYSDPPNNDNSWVTIITCTATIASETPYCAPN